MKKLVALYQNFKLRQTINNFDVGDYIFIERMKLGKGLAHGNIVYKIDDVVWETWFTPAFLILNADNNLSKLYVNIKDILQFSVYSKYSPKFKLGQSVKINEELYTIDHCRALRDDFGDLYFHYTCVDVKKRKIAQIAESHIESVAA